MDQSYSDIVKRNNKAQNRLIALTMGGLILLLGTNAYSIYRDTEQAQGLNESHQTIELLAENLAEQRDQFTECIDNSPTNPVPGCEEPIAADPAEIIDEQSVGAIGPTGPRGETGAPGPRGPMGPQGPQGIQGLQGVNGLDGEPGVVGARGHDGAQGPVGPAGIDGVDGAPGAPGPPGADGAVGPQGPPGADSTVPGPAGPQGPQGEPGPTCPSGYEGRDIIVLAPEPMPIFACVRA